MEECFTGHLVQANSDNKEIMKKKLDDREGSVGIANFEDALKEAFNLLDKVLPGLFCGSGWLKCCNCFWFQKALEGSQCNQAIMLLTDGAVDNYQNIFERYNKERRVCSCTLFVFSFLGLFKYKQKETYKWQKYFNPQSLLNRDLGVC